MTPSRENQPTSWPGQPSATASGEAQTASGRPSRAQPEGDAGAGSGAGVGSDTEQTSATPPLEAAPGEGTFTASLHRELMLALQDFTTESSRYADGVRRSYGLAHSDVHALAEVMAGQRRGLPLRAGDIARRLVISASAATAVIDRLVNRGHLVRHHDHKDRREVVLNATPSAAATGKAMFAALERELGDELAGWSAEEIEVLRRRMPELTEAVRRAQDVTPPPPSDV